MCVQRPRMRLSQYHCSHVCRILVTGMALRWLLLGSSGSFFRGDTRERGSEMSRPSAVLQQFRWKYRRVCRVAVPDIRYEIVSNKSHKLLF